MAQRRTGTERAQAYFKITALSRGERHLDGRKISTGNGDEASRTARSMDAARGCPRPGSTVTMEKELSSDQ
jgi:hypothetical protein